MGRGVRDCHECMRIQLVGPNNKHNLIRDTLHDPDIENKSPMSIEPNVDRGVRDCHECTRIQLVGLNNEHNLIQDTLHEPDMEYESPTSIGTECG